MLSCPNCQADVSVTPAQAGDSIACPECQSVVVIPTLGELRKLPQKEQPVAAEPSYAGGSQSSFGFIALMLLAVLALLVTSYCGIRWAAIETTTTTEIHVEEIREGYDQADAASMIIEFDSMDRIPLEMSGRLDYQLANDLKAKWARNAAISGAIAVFFGIGGLMLASRRQSA
ncbi:hypothetical protein U8335_07740 [Roseiconus lacunae]|uniref:hypothetical protein n=1 Tax=Roseiconus lacunae TaxID=2605694 RepID=UPI0011F40171|nr:hypothetical protein U8335_07740 [Stieleria sp. HD01]